MTKEEAKAKQDRIAKDYKLSWWYGTTCNKCCGVYPRMITGIGPHDLCRFECEVCGTTTAEYEMPWQAIRAWNNGEFKIQQMKLF